MGCCAFSINGCGVEDGTRPGPPFLTGIWPAPDHPADGVAEGSSSPGRK